MPRAQWPKVPSCLLAVKYNLCTMVVDIIILFVGGVWCWWCSCWRVRWGTQGADPSAGLSDWSARPHTTTGFLPLGELILHLAPTPTTLKSSSLVGFHTFWNWWHIFFFLFCFRHSQVSFSFYCTRRAWTARGGSCQVAEVHKLLFEFYLFLKLA